MLHPIIFRSSKSPVHFVLSSRKKNLSHLPTETHNSKYTKL